MNQFRWKITLRKISVSAIDEERALKQDKEMYFVTNGQTVHDFSDTWKRFEDLNKDLYVYFIKKLELVGPVEQDEKTGDKR